MSFDKSAFVKSVAAALDKALHALEYTAAQNTEKFVGDGTIVRAAFGIRLFLDFLREERYQGEASFPDAAEAKLKEAIKSLQEAIDALNAREGTE